MREGAGVDGRPLPLFCADGDHLDANGTTRQWRAGHRHYRLMVKPPDGYDLHDPSTFARRIMVRAQAEISLSLEWVAAAYFRAAVASLLPCRAAQAKGPISLA